MIYSNDNNSPTRERGSVWVKKSSTLKNNKSGSHDAAMLFAR